jgi:nucleoside-diphosphate-sugar epimerase
MPPTVLVTGTFGLVGRETAKRLVGDGWHVVATAHQRIAADLPDSVEIRRSDLADAASVNDLVADARPVAIVHLAAAIPPLCYRDAAASRRGNVGATATLLKAAESQPVPPLFLHASSGSIFGPRNPHRVSERLDLNTPFQPCEIYGAQKLEAEELVRAAALPWTIMRLGSVFSADPDALPFTADAMYFGGCLPIDCRLHGIDTRDVASAFSAALHGIAIGRTLFIGGDDTHLIRHSQVIRDMAAARGITGIPLGRPGNPDSDTDWYAAGDWMDVTEAQRLLTFHQHSWPEMLDELRFNVGWRWYPTSLAAPLIRQAVRHRSPYRGLPGAYADPWGTIRTRFGEARINAPA